MGGVDLSGVASSISEGDIFIYSCSAQLISFEIDSISKEVNCAEHDYMNMSPSRMELATPLVDLPDMLIALQRIKVNCTKRSFVQH